MQCSLSCVVGNYPKVSSRCFATLARSHLPESGAYPENGAALIEFVPKAPAGGDTRSCPRESINPSRAGEVALIPPGYGHVAAKR